MEVLDEVPTSEWLFWECFWIEQIKQWGFKLENKNNGGGGSIVLSEKVKQIKSEKMKKFWENHPIRKSHKKVIDNHTGIIYDTIKDLLKSLNKKNQYKIIYKQIALGLRYSYC